MEKSFSERVVPQPPGKKVLADTKMSLAKWFCERILRVKSSNPTTLSSSPVPSNPQEDVCEQSVPFNDSSEDSNLNDIIIDCLNDSRLSIGLVGDSSSSLMNTILLQTTPKVYTKEYKTPPKTKGNEQCVLNYSMDEKFRQNWLSEEKNLNMGTFLLSEEVETNTINNSTSMNTPIHSCTFTFQYGEVPELIVGFKKQSDFLHPGFILGTIKPLLGKQIRFCGLGKNIQLDRIFIREKLKEIRKKYEAYTESFLIRMPSTFLQVNKEIVFYDGLRGSQIEQAQKFQYGINCLSCIVDERGISHNLRSFIISSGFLHKLYRNPKEFSVLFLLNNRNNFTLQPPALAQLQTSIRNQFSEILKEYVPPPYTAIVNKLISHLKVISIDTKISCTSLSMPDEEEYLRRSGISTLISTINNISIEKCADSIRFISDDWIEKNKESLATAGDFDSLLSPVISNYSSNSYNSPINSPFSPFSPATPDSPSIHLNNMSIATGEIPSTVKTQFETFKQELLGKIKSMDECLIRQAYDAFVLASSQVDSSSGVYDGSNNHINTKNEDFIYGSLMHTAPAYWKTEILESLPKQMEKIVQISSSLLKECVKTFGVASTSTQDSSTYEKVRLKRLMEFCNLLNQRTATRIQEISQSLKEKDADQMVREACEFTLTTKATSSFSLNQPSSNQTEALKKLSIEAAYNIKKQFSKILGGSISLLSDIEKDIYQSANLVMITLQTPPSPSSPTSPLSEQKRIETEGVQLYKKTKSEVEVWAKLSGKTINLPPDTILKLFDNSPYSLLSFVGNLSNHNYKQHRQFSQQLRSIGLSIKPLNDPIDANSQFKALAHQAYGSEAIFPVVRLLIIAEILTNYHEYEKFVKNSMDIQEYIFRMSKDGEQGDYVTLFAFANYYKADILVYSPVLLSPLLIKSSRNQNEKVYCLAYLAPNSYFSLVSSESSRKRSRETFAHTNYLSSDSTKNIVQQSTFNPITKKVRINDEDGEEMKGVFFPFPHGVSNILKPSYPSNFGVQFNNNNDNSLLFEEKVEIEMLENKFSTISLTPNPFPSLNDPKNTLSSLCISTIVSNISHYNSLSCLPEYLISKILRGLISTRNLSSASIVKLFSLPQSSPLTARFSPISCLDLSDCKLLTLPICETFAKYISSELKHINLSNATNITNEYLITLLAPAKHLEVINLTGCFKIDHNAIYFLAKNCSSLKSITLQGCTNISDSSVFELLQSNVSLKELNLKDCTQITDHTFSNLSSRHFSQLRTINLMECQVTDKSVISIANAAKSLLSLKLSGRGITDDSISEVARNCPHIQFFEVSAASITNLAIHKLASSCPKLHTLKLPSCRLITVDLFRPLPSSQLTSEEEMQLETNEPTTSLSLAKAEAKLYFPTLKCIDLSRNSEITDRTIEDLITSVNPKNIKEINFSSCEELSDRCFIKLAKSFGMSLSSLNLSKCAKLTDDSFAQIIKCCANLKKLCLYNCPLLSDRSILLLSTYCKQIEVLDLSSCEQITDAAYKSLSPLCNLKSLSLEEANITDQTLISILQNNHNLETLKLGYCKDISDSVISRIAYYCPSLKVVDLSYCSNISITALRSAFSQLHLLTELNLRGFNNLFDDGFEHPNLTKLNLSWCKNIEDAAISRIAKGCPSLVDLDLAWCAKLTKVSLYQLAEHCSALRTLNFNGCTSIPFLR